MFKVVPWKSCGPFQFGTTWSECEDIKLKDHFSRDKSVTKVGSDEYWLMTVEDTSRRSEYFSSTSIASLSFDKDKVFVHALISDFEYCKNDYFSIDTKEKPSSFFRKMRKEYFVYEDEGSFFFPEIGLGVFVYDKNFSNIMAWRFGNHNDILPPEVQEMEREGYIKMYGEEPPSYE